MQAVAEAGADRGGAEEDEGAGGADQPGANRLQRLWLVVVPQCLPGLAAGAFFAFNVSFDEAVLSLFLRKPGLTTLPVQIYGQLEFSPDPSVAAVSTIMIVLTVVLIFVIDRLLGIKNFAEA